MILGVARFNNDVYPFSEILMWGRLSTLYELVFFIWISPQISGPLFWLKWTYTPPPPTMYYKAITVLLLLLFQPRLHSNIFSPPFWVFKVKDFIFLRNNRFNCKFVFNRDYPSPPPKEAYGDRCNLSSHLIPLLGAVELIWS